MCQITIGLLITLVATSLYGETLSADTKVDAFVSGLLGKMTLEEKIGQLNLLSVGVDVTGPIVSKDVEANIRNGLVGGVFNTYTPAAVRKLQDRAVSQSRLHIPLLFGYDVIHGHKTIFPIPLALACTWNPELVERSAHIAATEASADGLASIQRLVARDAGVSLGCVHHHLLNAPRFEAHPVPRSEYA